MVMILNQPGGNQAITPDGQLTNGNNNGNNQQQQGNNSDQNGFEFDGFESEEDKELDDLFKGFGADADNDIGVDDDWLNPPKKPGEPDEIEDDGSEESEAAKTLMTDLQESLKNVKINPKAIPADFDSSNPEHLEKLLNHTAQQATSSAIALMMKPMKHYVESVQKELRSEIQTSVKRGGLQGDIQKAFAPFSSLKEGHKKLAQTLFREAYSTTRDLAKSTRTTAGMLKRLGVNVDLRQGSGGTQNAAQSQRFEGVDALDDFFGTPSKK